jgi:hypothetical protein
MAVPYDWTVHHVKVKADFLARGDVMFGTLEEASDRNLGVRSPMEGEDGEVPAFLTWRVVLWLHPSHGQAERQRPRPTSKRLSEMTRDRTP